jgi:hypothetical protein
MLKPSQWSHFEDVLTSSLADILANPSAVQGSVEEQTTPVTCGRTYDNPSETLSQDTVFLKTSKDIYRLDSPQLSATWKKMVTQQRGEYSARRKSALHTAEKECLSWATVNTMDYMDCRTPEGVVKQATGARKGRTRPANLREQVDPVTCEIYKQQNWPTASARDHKDTPGMAQEATNKDGSHRNRTDQLARAVYNTGQPDQENPSTNGSHQESWRTPSTCENVGGQMSEVEARENNRTVKLRYQVEQAKIGSQSSSRLNPRWVCTLMNIPIMWTEV